MLTQALECIGKLCERTGRYLEIRGRDNPDVIYLKRYYPLFPRQWEKVLPFNIYLHHFMHSDDEAWDILHDHPWKWWASLILSGGYLETTEGDSPFQFNYRIRRPGKLVIRKGEFAHRVDLFDEGVQNVWTLFIVGRRIRDWNFVKEGIRIPWKKYLGLADTEPER